MILGQTGSVLQFITKSFCLFGRLIFCILQNYNRLVDVCQIMTIAIYEMICRNCQQHTKQHRDSVIIIVFFLGFSELHVNSREFM